MTGTLVAEPEIASLGRRVEALVPGARVAEIRKLVGGSSGFTYVVQLDEGSPAELILKCAPAGVAPRNNRDVLRQAAMLRRLRDSSPVPVPDVIASDGGTPPGTPPLFLMSRVPGTAYEPQVDEQVDDAPPGQITQRAVRAAECAGLLSMVRIDDLLAGGEPLTSPADELERWNRVFGSVPADLRHGESVVHRRLAEHVPDAGAPSLVHGDWRLGNMLFEDTTLKAVLDWEMWSVGDARNDLAWLLMFLTPGHPHARTVHPTLPDRSTVMAAYEDVTARPVEDFAWFEALARYKHAAACAHVTKNLRRLPRPEVDGVMIERSIPELLQSAADFL